MTRAGTMKDRVTIQVNVPVASDYAENTDSWATLETVYADVEPITATENYRAGQPVGLRSYRVTTRFRGTTVGDLLEFVSGTSWTLVSGDQIDRVSNPGRVSTAYRLVYRGRNLEVTGSRNVGERHRFTVMTAQEAA